MTSRVPWSRLEQVLDCWHDESNVENIDDSTEPPSLERLGELCGGDQALYTEVLDLMNPSVEAGDLLDRGVASLDDLLVEFETVLETDEAARALGRIIDRYRIVDLIGQGGMGVVYLAERADDEFDKRVALKVIPQGLETKEKERRFRTERQILALLEHPNIARLLDGGVTEDGFPYLVMEFVDGLPIDEFCTGNGLSEREIVELMLLVCAAITYAHQNLIIHRDLKPSNILVGADGIPRLLDFGIAKILDEPEAEPGARSGAATTARTLHQPMTPAYASPEQLENRPATTASDVYSLGVVLYRLLAGESPTSGGGAPLLRGDLRIIVERALRPEPTQRFGSAGELADDLGRYLQDRPIESRPATVRYRLAKTVSRHPLATAATLVVAWLTVLGVAAVSWQAEIARTERDRAVLEASRAQQVAQLLGDMFRGASPLSETSGDLTAKELLARGELRAQTDLEGQPAVRGQLLEVIARAYSDLGDYERAEAVASIALEDLRTAQPLDRVALASALYTRASIFENLGQSEPALELLSEAVELLVASDSRDSLVAALVYSQLAEIEEEAGRLEESAGHRREALSVFDQHGMTTDAAVQKINLASTLRGLGRNDEATRLQLEGLAVLEQVYGSDHPSVASTRNNVATALAAEGRYDRAEAMYRIALEALERKLGPQHPQLGNALLNLGKVLMDGGRFEEAEPYLIRANQIVQGALGPDHISRVAAELNLATLKTAMGEFLPAIESYRANLERLERLTGSDSVPSARVRCLLGTAWHRHGDLGNAELSLRSALDRQRRAPRDQALSDTLLALGSVLSDLAQLDQAISFLREALEYRVTDLPARHWRIAEAQIELTIALTRLAASEAAGVETRVAVASAQEGAKTVAAERAREVSTLLAAAEQVSLDSSGLSWLRGRRDLARGSH